MCYRRFLVIFFLKAACISLNVYHIIAWPDSLDTLSPWQQTTSSVEHPTVARCCGNIAALAGRRAQPRAGGEDPVSRVPARGWRQWVASLPSSLLCSAPGKSEKPWTTTKLTFLLFRNVKTQCNGIINAADKRQRLHINKGSISFPALLHFRLEYWFQRWLQTYLPFYICMYLIYICTITISCPAFIIYLIAFWPRLKLPKFISQGKDYLLLAFSK